MKKQAKRTKPRIIPPKLVLYQGIGELLELQGVSCGDVLQALGARYCEALENIHRHYGKEMLHDHLDAMEKDADGCGLKPLAKMFRVSKTIY